jgi:hypothetical protein
MLAFFIISFFLLQNNNISTALQLNPFQNHPSSIMTQSLKDGSHNHPKTAMAASPSHDHSLRDGSHNHPSSNTMEVIKSRLAEANLVLPPAGTPKANYQLIHRDGDLLYLSGHLPMTGDGSLVTGCLAPDYAVQSDPNKEDPTHKLLSTQQG